MAGNNDAACDFPKDDKFGDNRWMATHELYVAEAKDKEPDVVFIGDSLIVFLEQSEVFKEYFAPLHCLCFGGLGDTTSHVLWRIKNSELECISPKVIVLSVGSDNVGHIAPQILEGIKVSVELISQKQPNARLIVLKLLPSGRTSNPRRQIINEVNEGMEECLKGFPNTHVLDIDPGFIAADGSIDHHDMFDFAHLTQEGFRKAFETVHLAIQNILNPDQ